jgi:chromosome segregation ATPase
MIKQLCGANNLNSVILATAHWTPAVPEDVGRARTKELVETDEFWGNMVKSGSRVVRHDGTKRSALQIVSDIVDRKTRVTLDIQRQLIDQGRNLNDTDAAQALQSELLAERKQFQERLSELKQDMDFAMRENDEKWQKQIKEEERKYTEKINKTFAETEALRTSLKKIAEEKEQQFRELQEEVKRNHQAYEEQIKKSSEEIKAAREESRRHAEEIKRQREADEARIARQELAHAQRMSELEARMHQEKDLAIQEQMEREREESERRFQQQQEAARATAVDQERLWQRQQQYDREREARLERERDEVTKKMEKLEKESKRSKSFFFDAVKAVYNVVSVASFLTGYTPWLGFWQ